MSSSPIIAEFSRAEVGLTRFPPNVEQVSVEKAGSFAWLTARRNDTELRFPLRAGDCRHLARLLLGSAEAMEAEKLRGAAGAAP